MFAQRIYAPHMPRRTRGFERGLDVGEHMMCNQTRLRGVGFNRAVHQALAGLQDSRRTHNVLGPSAAQERGLDI